jgi:hypothetical protein
MAEELRLYDVDLIGDFADWTAVVGYRDIPGEELADLLEYLSDSIHAGEVVTDASCIIVRPASAAGHVE